MSPSPGGPPKPLDNPSTSPPGSGTVVDEFGLDATPSVDSTPTLTTTIKTILVGKPRDLADTSIYHSLSLVAFLAWVGLGADGLSSSCYGPAEAFAMLMPEGGGDYRFLAIFLALATAATVFVISACYSHILEAFPSGGGGYLVASKLLGPKVGVVSGCALLVDYALTITTSIAAAGDAMFGLLSPDFHVGHFSHWQCKMGFESFAVLALIVLNLRGIKESVTFLLPIFIIFLITHMILIGGALTLNIDNAGAVVTMVGDGLKNGVENPEVGPLALMLLFLHAYSMGAGTYTGIEAVSNSMPVMREPRVQTGQHTMLLMAISLALTAGGLMIAYLLLDLRPIPDKTMNTVLSELFVQKLGLPDWLGSGFVLVTILSEGCLLFVAAQAGFIDGPRVSGQHGPRLLDAPLVRQSFGTAERSQRRDADGICGAVGAVVYRRRGDDAVGDVLDQRVRHVFVVDDRHVPALVGTAGRRTRSGNDGSLCSCSVPRCASAF